MLYIAPYVSFVSECSIIPNVNLWVVSAEVLNSSDMTLFGFGVGPFSGKVMGSKAEVAKKNCWF